MDILNKEGQIVSEYDQEILQSLTEGKPMAPRGSVTKQSGRQI